MPIEHTILLRQRRVIAEVTGTVAREDFFTYQRTVWSLPEVVGFDELVDLSGVARIAGATAEAMRELACLSAEMESRERSRLAIVATGDLFFGLGRMYEAFREMEAPGSREISVFRSRDEADRWLDESAK